MLFVSMCVLCLLKSCKHIPGLSCTEYSVFEHDSGKNTTGNATQGSHDDCLVGKDQRD